MKTTTTTTAPITIIDIQTSRAIRVKDATSARSALHALINTRRLRGAETPVGGALCTSGEAIRAALDAADDEALDAITTDIAVVIGEGAIGIALVSDATDRETRAIAWPDDDDGEYDGAPIVFRTRGARPGSITRPTTA